MISKAYSETGRECRVTFEIDPDQVAAENGAVLGDFNDWRPAALERREDGRFQLTLSLPAGRHYRFRYLFDGSRWENDETADAFLPNGFGSEDSLLVLPAAAPVEATATASPAPATAAPKAKGSASRARKPAAQAAPKPAAKVDSKPASRRAPAKPKGETAPTAGGDKPARGRKRTP